MEISIGSRFKDFLRAKKDHKLGTMKGVFIPNILQMIGVILFMRLGWVLGHVGTVSMLSIISLASCILIITSFSLSSIVSNMRVGSGGAYFIISRVLGIEFGSAIGILLCVSQHASIALCVSGFAVSLQEFLPHVSIKIIEAATLSTLILISYISTQLAVRAQMLIFITLFASVGSILLGGSYNIDPSLTPLDIPLVPLTFWMGFAMFFPAATGIEAGMSMSGDLRNPSRSIPLGTLASVLVAYLLYSGIAFFLSREVGSDMLRSHPFIVYHLAKIKVLVILGVWGATLSSALGSILGAPRVLQALGKDRVLPSFLAKGHGKENQPRTAILIVYGLAMTLTLATNINQIIPIMTMVCLVSYGLINFVAFFEGFLKNPSWRPNFSTPWPLSLLGCATCFTAMFLINPVASLIVIALTIVICLITSGRKIGGGWDDIRYSLVSFLVHRGAAKLATLTPNAKSWRPNILSYFDQNSYSKNLLLFTHALDHGKGFVTFGTTLHSEEEKPQIESIKEELSRLKIPSFVHVNRSDSSANTLVQQIKNYGFGPLVPNTVVLPAQLPKEALLAVLKETRDVRKNIVIFKSDSGNPRLWAESSASPKKIHLWWRGGNQKNFELCLALSYSLRGSTSWSGSEIVIKSLVEDSQEQERLTHVFDRTHKRLRIKRLFFSPIVDKKGTFFSNLNETSKQADLTFLGLREKREEETDQAYADYLSNLLEETKSIPNVAYVIAGEDLSFERIFN